MVVIDFGIGHFRSFRTCVTLTLDRVIRHTIVYHSSTSTYTPNFVQINFLWTDELTYRRTDGRRTDTETGFIRRSRT